MSSYVKNPTSGGNPKKTNNAGAPVFRAKAKPKVSPLSGANFDFSGDPRLGESFVVVIAGPDRTRTATFHRPIGKTGLDEESWVRTPTGEVPDLIARKEDPNDAIIRQNREDHRFKAAIAAGYITRESDDGEVHYPSNEPRQSILASARAEAKEAAKRAKTSVAPMAYLAHLSAERRAEEDALRQFLQSKAVQRAAEESFPDSTYRTRSGPLANRDQVAVKGLSGLSRAEAEDAVYRRIFS